MGQPSSLKNCYPYKGSQPGELKHLSNLEEKKTIVIPQVVASERGIAQTIIVPAMTGVVGPR